MPESTLSRRISEFLGVALFALALIWLISLVTLRADRPGVVLHDRRGARAGELRRPRRRVPRPSCRSSCSATPRICSPRVIASHRAGTTSGARRRTPPTRSSPASTLLFACASAFLSLVFGSTEVAGKTFHAGGSIGAWLGALLVRVSQSHRLDHRAADADDAGRHPVDAVLVRPDVRDAPAASRSDLSARGIGWLRAWLERAPQGAGAAGCHRQAREDRDAPTAAEAATRRRGPRRARSGPRAERADDAGSSRAASRQPPVVARKRPDAAPPLPLPEPEPSRRRRSAGTARSRCRRPRSSMRRRRSARSTSAS